MDGLGGFMDYENICKLVGQLFLESRKQIDSMSVQLRTLLSENAELKRILAQESNNGPKEERSSTS